jgi:basic membrane protein A
MVKRVDVALVDVVRDVVAGTFTPGVRELGLVDDGVGFVADEANRHLLPIELVNKVRGIRDEIIAGAIEVPDR